MGKLTWTRIDKLHIFFSYMKATFKYFVYFTWSTNGSHECRKGRLWGHLRKKELI